MVRHSRLAAAAAAILLISSSAVAIAQSQDTPAAVPRPAPLSNSPSSGGAPSQPTAATDDPQQAGRKGKARQKSTRARPSTQREVEGSLQSGTVPSRYRGSVPREYQKYIPFER